MWASGIGLALGGLGKVRDIGQVVKVWLCVSLERRSRWDRFGSGSDGKSEGRVGMV